MLHRVDLSSLRLPLSSLPSLSSSFVRALTYRTEKDRDREGGRMTTVKALSLARSSFLLPFFFLAKAFTHQRSHHFSFLLFSYGSLVKDEGKGRILSPSLSSFLSFSLLFSFQKRKEEKGEERAGGHLLPSLSSGLLCPSLSPFHPFPSRERRGRRWKTAGNEETAKRESMHHPSFP